MIDEDLHKLNEREAVPAFEHLPAAIWAGVALRQEARGVAKRQVAVMAVAAMMSGGVGFLWASSSRVAHAGGMAVAGAELAPSQLLFGAHR